MVTKYHWFVYAGQTTTSEAKDTNMVINTDNYFNQANLLFRDENMLFDFFPKLESSLGYTV